MVETYLFILCITGCVNQRIFHGDIQKIDGMIEATLCKDALHSIGFYTTFFPLTKQSGAQYVKPLFQWRKNPLSKCLTGCALNVRKVNVRS